VQSAGSANEPDRPDAEIGLSRREVLGRGALLGFVTAVFGLLGDSRIISIARAQSSDPIGSLVLTTDALNGFVAFIAPGNDAYSKQQGQATDKPGGVASNTLPAFILSLDKFVPASIFGAYGATIPVSAAIAGLLDTYALLADPAATVGPFLSPFANLSFADKAAAYKSIEADLEILNNELAFVGGILPGFAAFVIFSEAGAFDTATGELTGEPVMWSRTNFAGPSDGWPEFIGYYEGRKSVKGSGKWATAVPKP
jgi:hypothetical protein